MSDEELIRPCPSCGHTPTIHNWMTAKYKNYFQVSCLNCGTSGPAKESLAEMREAWNLLLCKLHWTKEKPTDANWYWVRFPKGEPNMGIAFIKNDFLEFAGEEQKFSISDELEYAGPIPLPAEDEQ